MANKWKKVDGKIEVTNETVETLDETDLLQKKSGLEDEVAILQAALADVNAQLDAIK